MKKNNDMVLGAVFVIIGVLVLLSNLGYFNFSWSYIWPLALLLPGIYMHITFFTGIDKNPGILVPGGILTTYGLLFYSNVFFGWGLMGELWPIFLIGISIGLFEFYYFGDKNKSLLIPISIFGGLGLIFLTKNEFLISRKYILPALLIIIGVLILTKNKNQDNKNVDEPKEKEAENDTKADM